MTTGLSGKVALITGAARGQGRAHAVRLSADGADVIILDIAGPLPASVPYDSPTPDDLDETAKLVAANGGRVVSAAVDIRDLEALCAAVDHAVADLGRLDIIVAKRRDLLPRPMGPDHAAGVPRHHRHQRDWHVEHGDGGGTSHCRRRQGRFDHPHRIGGRGEDAGVHGALHGKQARGHRNGARLRRRTRQAQHPCQQLASRRGGHPDGHRRFTGCP
jgi:short chain dehydrogenase